MALILANLVAVMVMSLRHKSSRCRASSQNLRVHIPATGLYAYPDLVVSCADRKLQAYDTLINPVLIAEVLSPSTQDYDRATKFASHRSIPSLQEHWTVAQDQIHVERWTFVNGHWSLTEYAKPDEAITLPDFEISISDIYRDIEFTLKNAFSSLFVPRILPRVRFYGSPRVRFYELSSLSASFYAVCTPPRFWVQSVIQPKLALSPTPPALTPPPPPLLHLCIRVLRRERISLSMRTVIPSKHAIVRSWHVIDANDAVLGRIASKAAMLLMGKHKPTYAPMIDTGDHVVIINAAKVKMTGNKEDQKLYRRHTGYPGGLIETGARRMRETRPERMLELAISGMLPKNKLGKQMYRKLNVYAGDHHPHQAQKPEALVVKA